MPRAILRACCVIVVLLPSALARAEEVPRWEWQPYRVRAVITAAPWKDGPAIRLTSLTANLQVSVERVIGPSWQFAVDQPDSSAQPDIEDGVPPWQHLPGAERGSADVWMRIHLAYEAGEHHWQVQCWQPELESVSPMIAGTTRDDRTVPDRLQTAMLSLFRPVARIDAVDGSDIRLQLRAGELPPADPDLAWVREGDLLETAVVFAPQGTAPGQRREIPWTVIEITGVEHATLRGQVHSGLRQALSARSRGRMQQFGAVMRPWYGQTELIVQTFGGVPRRLGGSRVSLVESLGDDAPPPLEMLTDRLGRLSLPREATPLRWLTVWSGNQRLARVPVVPGARPRLVLEVPDDSVRLGVEGQLQILQDRLVDAVASRNALLISLRKLAKQENWEAVDAGRQRLADLPGPAAFLQDLTGIRVPAVKEAQRQKNRAAEVKVNRLCDDTAAMIREYLNEDKLKVFREELAELRRAAKTADALPAEPAKPADR